LIEARGLTKDYGDKRAVDGLTFTVQPGIVTGFLGPNGSGKSTTMRLILGLDAPTAGDVTVNGKHYRDHAGPVHEVGALLEARSVHTGRSAFNHLLALAQTHGISRRRVDELIDLVGLREVAKKRAGEFSLGMVDEAIYALARQTPPTIKAAFYSVRAVQLRTGASLNARAGKIGGQGGGGGGGGAESQLRSDFPDTGYWSPAVQTGADGKATVQLTMPDSLTTWRLTAIGATTNTDVGYVTDDVVSTKTFHVDPAFPRFLVSGDINPAVLAPGMGMTGKAAKAALLVAQGEQIELLAEDDFIRSI